MARLWDKFLVLRRDGSIPEWPWLVLGARDPAATAGLRAMADKADELGMDPAYTTDLRQLADEWDDWRERAGDGDPDAGPHRHDIFWIADVLSRAPATVNFRGDR